MNAVQALWGAILILWGVVLVVWYVRIRKSRKGR